MKRAIHKGIFILVLLIISKASVFGQVTSDSPFRLPTDLEKKLHDDAYITLQQEINSKICNENWTISETPFLIKDHPGAMIVIKNYYKEYGNIPEFSREGETFKIGLKPTSALYKEYIDSINSPPFNVSRISSLASKMHFASISLELNINHADIDIKGKVLSKMPGINKALLYKDDPIDGDPDTTYKAYLFLGRWPKLQTGNTEEFIPFPFTQHKGNPIIENMVVTISTHNYPKLMQVIRNIDWGKMEDLINE